MAKLIRLDEMRRRRSFVHFSRQELNLLLQLYSKRVANGEWRDYAIQHDTTRARFMVFRNWREGPAYSIIKLAPASDGKGAFLVATASGPIRRGRSLGEVLTHFQGHLSLVSSGS
jgi:hypothetical protein